MSPSTSSNFKGLSKRLTFNRKKERESLPVMIVNFDGVIGVFIKEDFTSD